MVMDSGDMAGMVITIVITIGIAGTIVLRGPLGKALARAIELGAGGHPQDDAKIAQLEHRVAELETAQGRLTELEERIDFAERLLVRPDAPVRQPHQGEPR